MGVGRFSIDWIGEFSFIVGRLFSWGDEFDFGLLAESGDIRDGF